MFQSFLTVREPDMSYTRWRKECVFVNECLKMRGTFQNHNP